MALHCREHCIITLPWSWNNMTLQVLITAAADDILLSFFFVVVVVYFFIIIIFFFFYFFFFFLYFWKGIRLAWCRLYWCFFWNHLAHSGYFNKPFLEGVCNQHCNMWKPRAKFLILRFLCVLCFQGQSFRFLIDIAYDSYEIPSLIFSEKKQENNKKHKNVVYYNFAWNLEFQ